MVAAPLDLQRFKERAVGRDGATHLGRELVFDDDAQVRERTAAGGNIGENAVDFCLRKRNGPARDVFDREDS